MCQDFISFSCEDIDFITFADKLNAMLNEAKFIDIKSKYLRIFLGNLRESLEIFGKVRNMFVGHSTVFRLLRRGNLENLLCYSLIGISLLLLIIY